MPLKWSWGPVHRKITRPSSQHLRANEQCLYLTFDDGPNPECTPKILDLLEKNNAHATFFVVGQKAQSNRPLVLNILSKGHKLGNHSYDHQYRNYFFTPNTLQRWIDRSENVIQEISGEASVGFRSPAGVITPVLHYALRQLKIPLVHWNMRFYDTRRPFTKKRAIAALDKCEDGSIILLHDSHRGERVPEFLNSLESFIVAAKKRGFTFKSLERKFFS